MVNHTHNTGAIQDPQHSVAVLGAGSYGTALAIAFGKAMPIILWGHDADHINEIAKTRCNERYIPGAIFPDTLELSSDLKDVCERTRLLIIAVPSHALPSFLHRLQDYVTPEHFLLIATKGLEQDTGRLFSDIIPEILPNNRFGFLSGPSFAKEVAHGGPTALCVASKDIASIRKNFLEPMHANRQPLKLYYVEDMIGLQIAGAIKNVIAIAVGLSDGLGYGANARAAVITHGLEEISLLGAKYGADPKTFQGLAGFGDLILTCTDNQSRNRRFGLLLGQGYSPEQAIKEIGQVVEGYYNTRETIKLARKVDVELPVIQKVYDILFNKKSPKRAAFELLLTIHVQAQFSDLELEDIPSPDDPEENVETSEEAK